MNIQRLKNLFLAQCVVFSLFTFQAVVAEEDVFLGTWYSHDKPRHADLIISLQTSIGAENFKYRVTDETGSTSCQKVNESLSCMIFNDSIVYNPESQTIVKNSVLTNRLVFYKTPLPEESIEQYFLNKKFKNSVEERVIYLNAYPPAYCLKNTYTPGGYSQRCFLNMAFSRMDNHTVQVVVDDDYSGFTGILDTDTNIMSVQDRKRYSLCYKSPCQYILNE